MSVAALGMALGMALTVSLMGGAAPPVVAGGCADQGNGQWLCSGAAVGGEAGAFLGGGVAGQPVVVDLAPPGFGLTTADSTGLGGAIALY